MVCSNTLRAEAEGKLGPTSPTPAMFFYRSWNRIWLCLAPSKQLFVLEMLDLIVLPPDLGLNRFPSVFQTHPFSVKVGSIRFDGQLK